jgi:hypothetical protein
MLHISEKHVFIQRVKSLYKEILVEFEQFSFAQWLLKFVVYKIYIGMHKYKL